MTDLVVADENVEYCGNENQELKGNTIIQIFNHLKIISTHSTIISKFLFKYFKTIKREQVNSMAAL